jgi:hypothetical protein
VSIILNAEASQALYNAAVANGGSLSVHFQSATCGNDILDGRVNVAEPSDYAAIGVVGVLSLIGFSRRRRNVLAG